ncbi:hypothetical protein [Boudabousia marimammalium]|uniref:Uncharacterized protein n=1 Tax=Boudabousia marimammalium TaxID=156892 RepID=A0A1Q5PSH9_9ACTO|nr:hypothetical protein [Boudabousia marimammalium]OKL50538.1 hypothetical protein BM477_00785 [Boudabousia marimammalium]
MEKGGQTADPNVSLGEMLKRTDKKIYAIFIAGIVVFLLGVLFSGFDMAYIGYPVSVIGFAMAFYGGFQFRRQWNAPEPGYIYGVYGITPDVREENNRND